MATPQLIKLVIILLTIGFLIWRWRRKAKAEAEFELPTRSPRPSVGPKPQATATIATTAVSPGDEAREPLPPAPAEPVQLTLPPPAVGKLVTEDGGDVALPRGEIPLTLSLCFLHRDDEEAIDLVESQLTYTAEDGTSWTGTGGFGGAFALEAFLDTQPTPSAYFERDAPPPWLTSLHDACLLAGVRDLWDDRTHYRPTISGNEVSIPCKYQGPTVDIGLHRDAGQTHFVIRVRGLYGGDDSEMLDPIVFLLEPGKLVFRNTLEEEDGVWFESGEDRAMVMRRGG